MTQDEIIEMARQAGCGHEALDLHWVCPENLEAFAKLVEEKATEKANARANASWTLMCEKMVAIEREACAKICDLTMLQNQEAINELDDDEHIAKCFIQGAMTQLVKTAKAIRARSGEQA